MHDWVMQHAPELRLGVFLGLLAVMAGWELLAPRRQPALSRLRRWPANFALVVLDSALLRLLLPVLALGAAVLAGERGWGLFNLVDLPAPLETALAVLLLDLAIYWQHRLFHAVPLLWRLHMVHHTDLDFDVTTGVRFHPVEIVLSMLIKIALVLALGAAPLAVLLFEVLLNGTALFNHANIRLPERIDRWLRLLVVTPDMHRVHHSVRRAETDSNFGFNLPWWDRLFATYRAQPADGHAAMTIGLPEYRELACTRLGWVLLLPFRRRLAG